MTMFQKIEVLLYNIAKEGLDGDKVSIMYIEQQNALREMNRC